MTRESVSVVITCYNNESYLAEAIACVRAQTRAPDEVMMIDDASRDSSVALAEAAGVRVFKFDQNGGVSRSRNKGLEIATSEFVAFLDADDTWEPFHLETLMHLLEQHEEVALAFGLLKSFGLSTETQELLVPANVPFDAFMLTYSGGGICSPDAMIVRRTASIAAGGFRKSQFGNAEDYDFIMRLAQKHPVIGTPVVVGGYRKHGTGLSSRREGNREAEFESRFLVLERARKEGAANVSALEEGMRASLLWRFEEAWGQRDEAMLAHYMTLGAKYVPASHGLIQQWQRKTKLFPVARVADRARAAARKLIG